MDKSDFIGSSGVTGDQKAIICGVSQSATRKRLMLMLCIIIYVNNGLCNVMHHNINDI